MRRRLYLSPVTRPQFSPGVLVRLAIGHRHLAAIRAYSVASLLATSLRLFGLSIRGLRLGRRAAPRRHRQQLHVVLQLMAPDLNMIARMHTRSGPGLLIVDPDMPAGHGRSRQRSRFEEPRVPEPAINPESCRSFFRHARIIEVIDVLIYFAAFLFREQSRARTISDGVSKPDRGPERPGPVQTRATDRRPTAGCH